MKLNFQNLEKFLQLNKLTEKQRQMVLCEKTPILVSASAGSGKTLSLCNRILFKLLNPKNNITPQDLLVVSFTKSAAEEIFNRLKNKLNNLIKQFPKEPILKKQLNNLSQKNITTIDSFCSNFLKDNFEAAKISPNFKIGTEIEFFEIKQKILENIFDHERKNNLENFQNLSNYFSLKSEDGLKNAIIKIFEKSRTNPFPEQFLINLFKQYKKPTKLKQNKNLTLPISQEIVDRINNAKNLILNSINYMDDPILKKSFEPICRQNANSLNQLLEKLTNLNYEDFYKQILNFKTEPLPRYSKKNNNFDQTLAEYIKTKFLNPAKKLLNSTHELLIDNEQFLNDQRKQKPIVQKLIHLSFIFSKQLNIQKKLTNTLEFSDLILKTIKLLIKKNRSNNKLKLTPLGQETKNKFNEVLIDEFQDINKPQELLFNILSDDGKNLFAVGDLKQSIYRFRQADPEIFLKYIYMFKKQNKTVINLQNNFRSHCEITNTINFLFGQIMSQQFGGIDYEKTDALICNNSDKPSKENFTEFHILTQENDEAIDKLEFEMKHVACQINNMIQKKFLINENGQKKPCEPKHFAILLRSDNKASETLCKELEKFKIPFYVDEKNQLLNNYEINIIIAMLKIINNPLDDIAFCAVAKSPIFNFTDVELATIKNEYENNSFFIAFSNSKSKKCKLFLEVLFNFRQKLQIMTISQLLQNFYNLDIFNNIFLDPDKNSKQTLTVLNNFLNLISQLEQNDINLSLSKLLTILKTAKNSNLNLNIQTNSNFEEQNLVKIMTIHKSKGLEFPIVFLPMCAQNFNKQDFNTPIIISNKFGIGLKHSDPNTLTRYNTINFNCILSYEKNEYKNEELRLLYVAMTRAKQKLILIATDNDKKFKNTMKIKSKTLPASFCRTKNSFYEWLLSGFMRHENSFFNKTKINFNKDEFKCNILIKNKFEKTIKPQLNTKELDHVKVQNFIKEIENRLNFKIQTDELSKIPAKMSVSEITKPQSNYGLKKLSFTSNQNSPVEIGLAMHSFLQHVNFIKAKQNLKKEIKRLIEEEFISKEQASRLNLKQLANFLNSTILKLIENANSIEREKNIIFEMSANKINRKANNTPIIIQGTIDLLIKNKESNIIVDYKTDKINNKNLKILYKKQLKTYKYAIEKTTKKRVSKCLIYSFYSNSAIEID